MKRLLSTAMAVLMTATMASSAFAAAPTTTPETTTSSTQASPTATKPGPMRDIDQKNFREALKVNGNNKKILLDNKAVATDKLEDLQPEPGYELKIYLTDTMFVDANGTRINTDLDKANYVTRTQLQSAKITVRRASSRGTKAFQTLGVKYDKLGAYISVKFADPFVSISDLDFGTTFRFYVNNNRRKDADITIGGTLNTDSISVWRGDEYVDMVGGRVVEAEDRITGIELDLGNELSIHTNLVKGRKYYAYCSVNPTNADISIMNKYPGIVNVYTLRTINLTGTTPKVAIDTDGTHYVYNAQGEYLGTTNQKLPLSTKYYVSDKKYASIK